MDKDVTNGIGPDPEQLVRGVDNIKEWDTGWRNIVLTRDVMLTYLRGRNGVDYPVFGMGIDRDPIGPDVPYAFTPSATHELEDNTPETGCWDCQNTIAGARHCRRPAHGWVVTTPAAEWTAQSYASTNHLANA